MSPSFQPKCSGWQCVACFCGAHKLRVASTFLNGCKTIRNWGEYVAINMYVTQKPEIVNNLVVTEGVG